MASTSPKSSIQGMIPEFQISSLSRSPAAPFALTNFNLTFTGVLHQFETIKGVLTANKPDLKLFPSHSDPVNVTAPVEFNLKDMSGRFEKAKASLSDYQLNFYGGVKIADNGRIIIDANATSNEMPLKELLPYLPENVQEMLGINDAKDKLKLNISDARVTINTSRIPQITIGIQADTLMNLGFAVVDGFMTPDKSLEYHISLTESPFRMHHGLKIYGSLDSLKFDMEPSKYPNHYTPLKLKERVQFHRNLRKMIAERLKNRLHPDS